MIYEASGIFFVNNMTYEAFRISIITFMSKCVGNALMNDLNKNIDILFGIINQVGILSIFYACHYCTDLENW